MTGNARRPARATLSGAALVLGGALASAPALGQETFALDDWNYQQAYQGWSAEQLMDEAEVYGEGGEEIGSVENMVINEQGQIVAIIAQVGGLWDIGDTHVAVPWKEVTFERGRVMIPVTEENVDDYSVFKDEYFTKVDVGTLETVDDDVRTGPEFWKATDLIDDYAVLEDGAGYGYVNDIIFDDDGKLQAVVVNAAARGPSGFRAYPWFGPYEDYAWEPGLDRYVLPYDEAEIAQLDTEFDYARMEDATGVAGGEAGEPGAGSDVGAAPGGEKEQSGEEKQ